MDAINSVGQGSGKGRSQQVHIELQIAVRIFAKHRERAAAPVGGTEKVESDGPQGRIFENCARGAGCSRLIPAQQISGLTRQMRFRSILKNTFTGRKIELQFKAVKIVAAESGQQDAANLLVVARDFEFFGGAANPASPGCCRPSPPAGGWTLPPSPGCAPPFSAPPSPGWLVEACVVSAGLPERWRSESALQPPLLLSSASCRKEQAAIRCG